MALVLQRGVPGTARWAVPCALLPFLGCASAPRGPGPGPATAGEDAAAPGTWADGLDGLVFGADEAAGDPGPPGAATAESRGAPTILPRGADLERTAALAVEAVREDRLEDAAPLLEEAAALAPAEERWVYERALADVSLGLGRSADAARIYEGIIGSPAAGAETLGNLAVAYYRLGDAERARAASTRALEVRPGSPEALKTLGLAEILDGEKDRGAERLREALGADPGIPEALLALAEIEEERGDRTGALERYRKLLEISMAAEARGRDPGRRVRGLFLFRPVTAGEDGRAQPSGTREELEARIQRLLGGGRGAP